MGGSLISQRYGRRLCMFFMSCYALVTATITVTSQSKGQILAARILNCRHPSSISRFATNSFRYICWHGIIGRTCLSVRNRAYSSSWICGGNIPAEHQCEHQFIWHERFTLMNIKLGGAVINSICRGTSTLEGNKSWRIPFGLFFVIPFFIICSIWFIPEVPSPLG